MKKFTIQDVQTYLDINDVNKDCILLSDSYVNSHTKLLFRCNKCGENFERSFSDVKRNEKFTCARCSRGRNLSIEDVQNFLLTYDTNNDCTLLSTTYKNYSTPLRFKCNCCGQEFERKMSMVHEKHFKCYDCLKKEQGGYNRLSLTNVKDFIKKYDINNDCTLLSTSYINSQTPLLFKCNQCGNEYERTYATMRSKKAFSCFRCSHHLPQESTAAIYTSLNNYFRGKLFVWKKTFLIEHKYCDITGKNIEDFELDIHHLTSFSTILKQASLNTNIPLIFLPQEFAENGYDLNELTQEFLKLHRNVKAVLLDKKIHQLFHNIYGYKNNTPEQYDEFKMKIMKGEIIIGK